MTSGVGSMAVTEDVLGSLAAEEAKMPPPQPTSRYAYFLAASGPAAVLSADVDRQDLMKSWRSGFMRWRRREGPWGSHHDEARLVKCVTSEALTEEPLPLGCAAWAGAGVLEWRRAVVGRSTVRAVAPSR